MNLNQLKLFYLAIKHKSLSNAAAELNITQPAVTKGIQRLQEYYEIKFVERLGKKLVLTEAGPPITRTFYMIHSKDKFISRPLTELIEMVQKWASNHTNHPS